jgi:hypothetical protein
MTTEQDLYPFPATVDEVIDRAAKHLPEGYSIKIEIEKDGYNVGLERPDGSEVNSVDGGDGIRSDINEAICIANGFVD